MANRSCRGVVTLGKQILANNSALTLSPSASRRSLNTSVYDKNVEDHVRPVVVPDDIVRPQSEKYWGPNPQTGVFGPGNEHNLAAGRENGFHFSAAKGGSESVLEQKAFFRPMEDLEKPQQT